MLEQIVEIAKEAGREILKIYADESRFGIELKGDDSTLTQADLVSHRVIISKLSKITDSPIISEEAALPEYSERKQWNEFWLVDPLDGTKEFIKRNGEFTVNIALIKDGEPVFGVIYIPVKDITYFAEKGKGSYKQIGANQPVRIYASKKSKPEVAIVSRSHANEALQVWLNEKGITQTIDAGSSLKFCLVAEGLADVYPRTGPTMEWDVAAGDCIWRNACENGQNVSDITYNKEDLRNSHFTIGIQ
ncbi:3'(2'),5'-bisphosphate nucleotidase [bacterium]|nr:MAG: 3'(2'),5'-bisphosphate nucleotidase [bacterium]